MSSISGAQTPTPVTKWLGHPNLRLRPVKPAKGNGRIQRQVRRAFMVGGPVLTSSQVYAWARSGRAARFGQWERWSITKVLLEVADQIGHASTRGKPWLWRLKQELHPSTGIDIIGELVT